MADCLDRRSFLRITGGLAAAVAGLRPSLFAAEACDAASASAEKLGWRLGCCAYTFNNLTFYETIDKVASLGLKAIVGFNWQKLSPKKPDAVMSDSLSVPDRKEVQKRLGDAGIKLTGCYCSELVKEDACRRLFAFAREMGIETIVGEPPTAAFDMLDKLCNEYQVNLAVHNHAKPSPNWRPETLLKYFKGRSKRIGACCDTGHWARSGLDPVETLRKLDGRILTFDLKDVNEKGFCVPFGTGKGDIRAILKELHRQQFQGVLGIEYDQHSANLEKDLRQCIAFFNREAQALASEKS